MAGPGFLSTILDRTGKRLQERLEMEKELRKSQSELIIKGLQAVDEKGQPVMSDPQQREDAWNQLTKLNSSSGAKDIIGKAKGVFDMIHQKIAPTHNQMFSGGQGPQPQQDQQVTPPTDAGDTEGTTGGMPAQANALPFTPPPPGRQLPPVQNVANAAASQPPQAQPQPGGAQPQSGVLPAPPPRTSMPSVIAAGSPEAAKVRDARALQEAETKRQVAVAEATGQYKKDIEETKGLEKRKQLAGTLTAQMRKTQTVPIFDDDYNMTGTRPLNPDEMTDYDKSIVAKNNAAVTTADARKQMAQATQDFDKARATAMLDPTTPVNQMKLFQIQAAAKNLALREAMNGLRTKDELAKWYGVDENGNEIPGVQHDEYGRPVGSAFSRFYAPTSATLTRVQAATPAIAMAQKLVEMSEDPNNTDLFGPEGAIKLWAAGKIGTGDARLAKFEPDITSLASFLRAMHGVRSEEATNKFKQTLSNINSPAAFRSAVEEYMTAAGEMQGEVPQPYSKAGATGKIRIKAPDGTEGNWPANKPLPTGFTKVPTKK